MFLNNLIQEDVKIQLKYEWLILAATILTSDSIAIVQYHRSQWKQLLKIDLERVIKVSFN